MKRIFALSRFAVVAVVASVVIFGMLSFTSAYASVAGSYFCYPDCGGAQPIVLSANGNWHWGGVSAGKFQVSDGSIVFDGLAGPATWGPATLGRDAITFSSDVPPYTKTIYRKASAIPDRLIGVYGMGRATLTFRPDGTWAAESPRGGGAYIVFSGTKVRLLTGGEQVSWGAADIGSGTLTFHPGGRLVGFSRMPEGTEWVFRKR